jgi:hypothetical protein
MAASNNTVADIVSILVEEVGVVKAQRIVRRLQYETTGNASYQQTLARLGAALLLAKVAEGR